MAGEGVCNWLLLALLYQLYQYSMVDAQLPSHAENVTEVLDRLLKGYRKEIRPGFGGAPLVIETDLLIRTWDQISESTMEYSFQCYFRQRWTDERLKFEIHNITEVTLNNLFLSHIWKPNTYFLNGQRSHQHRITTPNLFVRIRNDGRVYLSRRLTVKASCPMKLNTYPMDKQVCPLVLGSYGFTSEDVIYLWKYGNEHSVEVSKDVRLTQFDLVAVKSSNDTDVSALGSFSVLKINIFFERHLGFFILQTYLPCSMIVCLSWVSFWINRDASNGRVLLGVTTILASVGIRMGVRDGLPPVTYATALDMYLNVCVMYQMAAIMEYALVNYFTKVLPLEWKPEDEEDEVKPTDVLNVNGRNAIPVGSVEAGAFNNVNKQIYFPLPNRRKDLNCVRMCGLFLRCLTGNIKYRSGIREKGDPETGNSVSDIDMWCRIAFPVTFTAFNIGYWLWYMIHKGW